MGAKTSQSREASAERYDAGLLQEESRAPSPSSSRSPQSQRCLPRGPWSQLKDGYAELINAIIRPPKAEYCIEDLGPTNFRLAGRQYERTDLRVPSAQGLALASSWWKPIESQRQAERLPCVVYMHGNSSCRLEAIDILPGLLQTGITLFAFDFAGCGLSEGDSITLGYREKNDLRSVIDFLRTSGRVSTIALWGRSMGAATALLHGHRDPSIAAMVLDSPFASLERLAREVVDRAQLKHKPSILVNVGIKLIRSTVLKRTGGYAGKGLDILKLRPVEEAHSSFIPAMFVAGADDQFISPRHCSDIYEQYAGDKSMTMVDGGHNSPRPRHVLDSIAIFLYNTLCVPAGLTEENLGLRPSGVHLGLPGNEETLFASPRNNPSGGASRVRSMIRSQLESTENLSEDDVARLVGAATDRAQSTLPERRTAASALRL